MIFKGFLHFGVVLSSVSTRTVHTQCASECVCFCKHIVLRIVASRLDLIYIPMSSVHCTVLVDMHGVNLCNAYWSVPNRITIYSTVLYENGCLLMRVIYTDCSSSFLLFFFYGFGWTECFYFCSVILCFKPFISQEARKKTTSVSKKNICDWIDE